VTLERADSGAICNRRYIVGVENPVVLFDSDCGFCRWSLSKILAWDRAGRLRPVALQSSEADDLLSEIDPQRKRESWHLIVGGRIYSGGEAVPHLAKLLPAGTPIALLAGTFPQTTDRAYRWVARHRDHLGSVLGEQACAVDPISRTSTSGG
jgi:predicted DCC family thiol-disulfide oxidoreductase YuxK